MAKGTATDRVANSGTFYLEPSPVEDDQRQLGASVADGDQHSSVQSTTGPVGEPGLPPSRPSSIATGASSQVPLRSSAAPFRRGLGLYPSATTSTFGNDGSRPNTAASKTHAPNVIPAAFFQPMSSRQLREQAQRPTSPLAQEPIPLRKSGESRRTGRKHRYSNASVVTIEQGQRPMVDADAPPVPVSRHGKAEDTQSDDQAIQSVRSQGSRAPLRQDGSRSNLLSQRDAGRAPAIPRSPRSFRNSFGLQSKQSRNGQPRANGHKKLASEPPSEKRLEFDDKPIDPGKKYEYYNGNAVFFCHGRLLNSRQRPLNLVTAFLAILPAILFLACSAPWLWHHVSPAIPILFAYVSYICISSYVHASFSDPGIIPRNLNPHPSTPSEQDPLALGPATTEWVTVRSFGPSNNGSSNMAMEVPIKYCKSCNIWRPPRAHHCRVCDACIETQDHHCVWLNNCVGRRNYRYFLSFVGTGTLLAFFLFAASLAHILVWMKLNDTSFGTAINHWRVPFAMVIYSVFIIPYPTSLFGYHLFLMARGESTREYLNSHKFLKKDRHRPFSQHNILRNWMSIVCRPRPPTYMRFKLPHSAGDQTLPDTKQERKKTSKASKALEKEGGLELNNLNGGSNGFQGPAGRLHTSSTSETQKGSPEI